MLDEISEMDLNLQVKLLRVLQEREVERLGSRKSIKLDVRVLATSNRDLKQYVSEGNFREDLYYRLNVFPLVWPSLAERTGDILPLAKHLLERHCVKQGSAVPTFTVQAQQKLLEYQWPGNVRELDNVIQRAMILANGPQIDADAILLESLDWLDACSIQPAYDNALAPTVSPVAQPAPMNNVASSGNNGREGWAMSCGNKSLPSFLIRFMRAKVAEKRLPSNWGSAHERFAINWRKCVMQVSKSHCKSDLVSKAGAMA